MKILLLNPHLDAEHNFVQGLRKQGFALLCPADTDEAWKMLQLHGSSVDLAVIHREGEKDGTASDAGLALIALIKGDPTQRDLPIILSSQIWKNRDFAQHQQTPMGVNAYLEWPYSDAQLATL